MTRTITLQTTLELQTCAACGITFAAPDHFFNSRRDDHKSYYCPNGHSLWFPQQSDAEKAQAEAAKYKKLWQSEAEYAAGVVAERNAAQKELRSTRGQMTRLKKRIAGGVCPCCHRTFVQLARHMETKHPDYAVEEQAK